MSPNASDGALEVALLADDLALASADPAAMDAGANLAIVGDELVQFTRAERTGTARWRLTGLLRGRGGTEPAARIGHAPGAHFTLLDDTLLSLPSGGAEGPDGTIAALGLVDREPVIAPVVTLGTGSLPPPPVHLRMMPASDGRIALRWVRRARGCWTWPERVEVPLVEEQERYLVGLGDPDQPLAQWPVAEPTLRLDPSAIAQTAGRRLWVRQIGTHGMSPPAYFTSLD